MNRLIIMQTFKFYSIMETDIVLQIIEYLESTYCKKCDKRLFQWCLGGAGCSMGPGVTGLKGGGGKTGA